jgi:hypothetical protein
MSKYDVKMPEALLDRLRIDSRGRPRIESNKNDPRAARALSLQTSHIAALAKVSSGNVSHGARTVIQAVIDAGGGDIIAGLRAVQALQRSAFDE